MNYRIWIKKSAINEIYLGGLKWLPKETGGVLMGYRVSAYEFVITNVIGPGKKAIHEHSTFYPDQEFHEAEIAKIYEASGCLTTYLGDWHTHPNSFSYLSQEDKKTLSRIANYKEARLKNPLMLIAAPPENGFKVWSYHKTKRLKTIKFVKCRVIIYE